MTFTFAASFLYVGLKAFQQLNVVHDERLLVVPISLLMATCEVFIVSQIVVNGFGWIVLWIGLGAGLGALFSMSLHKRMRIFNGRASRKGSQG